MQFYEHSAMLYF